MANIDENYDGTTKLRNWHPIVKKNFSAVNNQLVSHISDKNNPHAVTKAQIGLEGQNVEIGFEASASEVGIAIGSGAGAARNAAAIGDGAFAYGGGGAFGSGARAGAGFAGGAQAKTTDAEGAAIDAIQLGTGTNSAANTLQIYDKQLLDADGFIPAERLPADAPVSGPVQDALDTLQAEINTKAPDSEVAALEDRVTTAEGNITANAADIALKVGTDEFNATVDAISGQISAAENDITAIETLLYTNHGAVNVIDPTAEQDGSGSWIETTDLGSLPNGVTVVNYADGYACGGYVVFTFVDTQAGGYYGYQIKVGRDDTVYRSGSVGPDGLSWGNWERQTDAPAKENAYELMETITVSEAVSSIVRTQAADGTPYALRSVGIIVSAKTGAINSGITLYAKKDTVALNSGFISNVIQTAGERYGYAEVGIVNGTWSANGCVATSGYTWTANQVTGQSSGNAFKHTEKDYPYANQIEIRANTAEATIPAGTVIEIYGVKA